MFGVQNSQKSPCPNVPTILFIVHARCYCYRWRSYYSLGIAFPACFPGDIRCVGTSPSQISIFNDYVFNTEQVNLLNALCNYSLKRYFRSFDCYKRRGSDEGDNAETLPRTDNKGFTKKILFKASA